MKISDLYMPPGQNSKQEGGVEVEIDNLAIVQT